MNNTREVKYQEFKKSIDNPDLRFLEPILRLAGDNYYIRAATTSETGAPIEISTRLSQEQFDELKRIRRSDIHAQLNKPEEA